MKLILLALFLNLKVYPDTRVYQGVSTYQDQVVYHEKHREDWDDERLQKSAVTYSDIKGKLIGTLVSDYSQGLAVPNYILRDRRSQSLQGVRWDNDQLQTFTQYQKQQKAQILNIFPIKDQLVVAGPGLVVYVADNLDYFQSKDILDFQYVNPGKAEVTDFYIKYIASTGNRIEFEVGLSPWPFHIFGTRMKLIFDRDKKRLLFYRGPSTIRNEENHMMTIETDFYYPN